MKGSRSPVGKLGMVACVVALVCFVYVLHLYGNVNNRLKAAEQRNEHLQEDFDAVNSQLQALLEHKSKLERALIKEKNEHRLTQQERDTIDAQRGELTNENNVIKTDLEQREAQLKQQVVDLERERDELRQRLDQMERQAPVAEDGALVQTLPTDSKAKSAAETLPANSKAAVPSKDTKSKVGASQPLARKASRNKVKPVTTAATEEAAQVPAEISTEKLVEDAKSTGETDIVDHKRGRGKIVKLPSHDLVPESVTPRENASPVANTNEDFQTGVDDAPSADLDKPKKDNAAKIGDVDSPAAADASDKNDDLSAANRHEQDANAEDNAEDTQDKR